MFPENFTLLQNEGYLMQGCFQSSLSGLLQAQSAQPGPFYSAFFNYAIGLERLLKLLLMLDRWHDDRRFPDNSQLKQYGGKSGHNVALLHKSVLPLFSKYHVDWKSSWDLDDINRDLLDFLADFANGSRYFNLDHLAGSPNQHAENPIYRWQRLFYRAYAKDDPDAEPIDWEPDLPDDEMPDGHHALMAAARPHLCWRLVQLLIPLKELIIAIREHVHKEDVGLGGAHADISMPYMEEFLDFVCEDKTIVDDPDEWPY